jgi:hypothetical protein
VQNTGLAGLHLWYGAVMKKWVGALCCVAVIACASGCIPIGIKGSTMAGDNAQSCVARNEVEGSGSSPTAHRPDSATRVAMA